MKYSTITEPHLYLIGEVSDLDLHRVSQVSDGEGPHTAGHHVAVQGTIVLLFLEQTQIS